MIDSIPNLCPQFHNVIILTRKDSIKNSQRHHYNMLSSYTNDKNILLMADTVHFFHCLQSTHDLIMLNEEGIWGYYSLDRKGVDQLMVELDILLLQTSKKED